MTLRMDSTAGGIDIIQLAFDLAGAVRVLVDHARRFCHEVMLSGYRCPRCDGALAMIGQSRCRCQRCDKTFDPTTAFQRCGECGGEPRLRISRYQCQNCGRDVPSRFILDGPVFDREYFRQRMAESRQRQAERTARVRQMLRQSRSPPLPAPAAELQSIPGLIEALNHLVGLDEAAAWLPLCTGFDLARYEKHLRGQLHRWPVDFDEITALEKNPRLDRIWRFVTVIFMAHAGQIEIEQDGSTILLRNQHETDHQG